MKLKGFFIMAENKKSFLIYCDLIHTVEKLDDEMAGKLFKHLLRYVNDKDPTPENQIVDLVFEPIKLQLKRDLKRYESILEKRSRAGKASAEKRKQMSTHVESVEHTSANPTDTDTVTDTVTDNVIDIKKEKSFKKEVWDCYDSLIHFFPQHLWPKNPENWLDTIKKLNSIEKVPFEKIIEITKLAREDDFWSKVFLALPKLRKKDKDGIKYIVVFNEKFKTSANVKTINRQTEETIRKNMEPIDIGLINQIRGNE